MIRGGSRSFSTFFVCEMMSLQKMLLWDVSAARLDRVVKLDRRGNK